MKYLTVFFLLFCLTSCEYFDKKKVSPEEILQEDLRTFKWNEVDEYPSFANCTTSETIALRKQCFETTLTRHITRHLTGKRIIVTRSINDTIRVKFHISEVGTLNVLEISTGERVKSQIPEINKFIEESLSALPEISPAIKRGQQVKTEFTLPIHIQVDN